MLKNTVSKTRKLKNGVATTAVSLAFLIAVLPLVSVIYTTISRGFARLDIEFFTYSMRGIVGEGGGILHAIVGTLLITLAAVIISVPVGILTAVYLVEYSKPKAASAITFLVDVMSGIPSIVAGLFAYAVFALILGPGTKLGIAGALALALLMIPTVVRSSEEMLRLVPRDLREAALALGAPKWATVLKMVIPTALGGIVTGVLLGIARIIGETAPLLIAAGFTASMNYNLFVDRMQSLPVYVYTQISNQGNPGWAFEDRAWSAALVLILIVLALNLVGRLIARFFGTKSTR
ncbi:MAG TPA: phosphate ABC transporter permease PstA [Microbacteriaceae bacterium]|nr:phosphate ABC transporter permease PstA [Microbacteriaceae bacterium]